MKMKMKTIVCSGWLILTLSTSGYSQQIQDWWDLIALESTRAEVEKLIGKPDKYFETSGTYRTEVGRFHVWYSKGGCRKNVEGLQYNIPARRLTGILFYPKTSLPLEYYVSNIKDFQKQESPARDGRYLYTSPDETLIFETIVPNYSREFVYTIELQPGKDKQHLLCKDIK